MLADIGIPVLLAPECCDKYGVDALLGFGLIDETEYASLNLFTLLLGHLISNARILDLYGVNKVIASVDDHVDLNLRGSLFASEGIIFRVNGL